MFTNRPPATHVCQPEQMEGENILSGTGIMATVWMERLLFIIVFFSFLRLLFLPFISWDCPWIQVMALAAWNKTRPKCKLFFFFLYFFISQRAGGEHEWSQENMTLFFSETKSFDPWGVFILVKETGGYYIAASSAHLEDIWVSHTAQLCNNGQFPRGYRGNRAVINHREGQALMVDSREQQGSNTPGGRTSELWTNRAGLLLLLLLLHLLTFSTHRTHVLVFTFCVTSSFRPLVGLVFSLLSNSSSCSVHSVSLHPSCSINSSVISVGGEVGGSIYLGPQAESLKVWRWISFLWTAITVKLLFLTLGWTLHHHHNIQTVKTTIQQLCIFWNQWEISRIEFKIKVSVFFFLCRNGMGVTMQFKFNDVRTGHKAPVDVMPVYE